MARRQSGSPKAAQVVGRRGVEGGKDSWQKVAGDHDDSLVGENKLAGKQEANR